MDNLERMEEKILDLLNDIHVLRYRLYPTKDDVWYGFIKSVDLAEQAKDTFKRYLEEINSHGK